MGGSIAVLLQLNSTSIALGALVTPLVFLYPRTKRYFRYPQVVLGLNFSAGVLIG